jgi:hypothetical protein
MDFLLVKLAIELLWFRDNFSSPFKRGGRAAEKEMSENPSKSFSRQLALF